jgi:hypothetical protein
MGNSEDPLLSFLLKFARSQVQESMEQCGGKEDREFLQTISIDF